MGLPGPALTPYLVGLLVMLGMLGTFLGMVVTLNGAVFALEGTSDLQAIRSAFAAPIKGLGLAFGTSVAGVASSAMLGLMSALSRRERMQAAAREELDHLAWTEERLDELGDRPSLLNPLWYAGSFAIGLMAARSGDPISLGFVVETERQVEAHLQSHMDRLPAADSASRAIVAQMKADEMAHAQMAQKAGAVELPGPVKTLMQTAAKVMTTVAHRV